MAQQQRRVVGKRNPLGLILLVLVVLAFVGALGGGYYWYTTSQAALAAEGTATAVAAQQQASALAMAATTADAQTALTATAAVSAAELGRQYDLAVALENAGDLAQARAAFLEILKQEPGFRDIAERLRIVSEKLAESLYQEGVAASDQRLWAEAVARFDEVLAIAQGYKDTAVRRAAAARALDATPTARPRPTLIAAPTVTLEAGTTAPTAEAAATIGAAAGAETPERTAVLEATSAVVTATAAAPANLGQNAQAIIPIESEHPYANDLDAAWTVENNTGLSAARLYFSRIEIENDVDKIEIRDAEDRLIQIIASSYPDGFWTELVPGAVIKVVLQSDGSGVFWGFKADKLEADDYTTLGYSPHPYPDNSSDELTLTNNTPSPAGTRVVFDRVELEEGVDYIVIKDIDDKPYQWITGMYSDGFVSKAVPGSSIKVQLVSDGSGRAWGYNVARIETAEAEEPDPEPVREKALAESDHPFVNGTDRVWTMTNPDVQAASTKLHFSQIALSHGDFVQVLDANDTVIQTFWERTQLMDVWSDDVPGRVVKIRLITRAGYEDWGFRVDTIETVR